MATIKKLRKKKQALKAGGVTADEQAQLARLNNRIDKLKLAKDSEIGVPKTSEDAANDLLKEGARLYNQGEGYTPYAGDRVADFAPETEQAFRGITSTANDQAAGGLGTSSTDLVSRLLAGNINADALNSNVSDIASGSSGLTTEADLRDLLAKSSNEAYQDVIDTEAGKLTDDITRAIGFGNEGAIGSAYHTGAITDQVGDLRSRMAADKWDSNIANQSGILNQITGVQGNNIANRLNASTALSGEQFGNIGNLLSGINLAPTATSSLYDPYSRLGQVGAAREGQDTAEIQAAMDKFTEGDMQNLNRLGSLASLIGGTGTLASTPQAQTSSNPFGSILGGGILGNQLTSGSTLGTLAGGGLGLLGSLFS